MKIIENQIFIYGVFGSCPSYCETEDEKESYISDVAFLAALRDLEAKGHTEAHVRINSGGGSMTHGLACINAVRTSKLTLHAYIDGVAASMAADFFLAFKKENRHFPETSLLMIHAPSDGVWGNAKEHEECAKRLRDMAKPTIEMLARETGKTNEEIETTFYDFADHWLTAREAKEMGIIEEVETYETITPAKPEALKKMQHNELLDIFARKGSSIIKQFQYQDAINIFNNNKNDNTVTKQEIENALTNLSESERIELVNKFLPEPNTPKAESIEARLAGIEKMMRDFAPQSATQGTQGATQGAAGQRPNDANKEAQEFASFNERLAKARANPFHAE